jgi:hypothetical protein
VTTKPDTIKIVSTRTVEVYLDEVVSWMQENYPELLEEFLDDAQIGNEEFKVVVE